MKKPVFQMLCHGSICILPLITMIISCAHSQQPSQTNTSLVGNCEGCEAVFEFGETKLSSIDTLPDFNDGDGLKIMLSGTIYLPDGKTPARDVILYVYHTDQGGVYPTRGKEEGGARRHGYIRGWMKTGANGRYAFYTLKPGVYPNRSAAAHIHPIILEPNGKYYWISDFLFDDDPLLTTSQREQKSPRGGTSGLIHLQKEGNFLSGKRDIILGRNIPGYH